MVDQEVVVSGRRGWVAEAGDDGYCVQFYDQGESLWVNLDRIEIYQGEDDYPDWLGFTLIDETSGEPWIALRFEPEIANRLREEAKRSTDDDVSALLEEIMIRQLSELSLQE